MKHTQSFKTLLALATLTAMIGCHTSNQSLMAPVKDPQAIGFTAGKQTEVKFSPKTKILFVIDDSASMEGHQTNLRNNTGLMVDKISGADSIIDMKFAVTTIFDSKRYGPIVPKVCAAKNNEVLWYDNGTLLKPKAPQGKEALLAHQGSNFINRSTGFAEVLKETLNVGVKEYLPNDPCPRRGPEFEEYFTTIIESIKLGQNGGPNAEFFANDGSYLMIVILADTGDSSTLSAADVYNFVRKARNDEKGETFTIHAVTDPGYACANSANARGGKIELDKSGPIEKTLQLVQLAKGTVISVCDPQYGAKLAKLGSDLREKLTENMTIPLNATPEEGFDMVNGKAVPKLRLTLGGVDLPDGSWAYNTSTKTITLRDGVPWKKFPGESIKVHFTPVDLKRPTAVKAN